MENDILKHRMAVIRNIEKSFGEDIVEKGFEDEVNPFEYAEWENSLTKAELDEFEKAKHQDGDMHPNGKWVWRQSANGGKGDWRVANPKRGGGAKKTAPAASTTTSQKKEETASAANKKTAGRSIYGDNGYMSQDFLSYLEKNKEKIWPRVNFSEYTDIRVGHRGSKDSNYVAISGKNENGVRVTIDDAYITGEGTNAGSNQVRKNPVIKELTEKYKNGDISNAKKQDVSKKTDNSSSDNVNKLKLNGVDITVKRDPKDKYGYIVEGNGKSVKTQDPSFYNVAKLTGLTKKTIADMLDIPLKTTAKKKTAEKSSYAAKEADAYDKGDGKVGNYPVPTHTSYPAANLYSRLKNNRHFGFKYGLPEEEITKKLKDYKGNVKVSYHNNAGTIEIYRIEFK